MHVQRMLASLLLLAVATEGYSYNRYLTEVRSIKPVAEGFTIEFERTAPDSTHQKITLTDNDGIATLAVTQLMLVDRLRQLAQGEVKPDMKDYFSNVFKNGENQLLSVQRDALDKLIKGLQFEAARGNGDQILRGTDRVRVTEALKIALHLRGMFNIKEPWTMQNFQAFGEGIQKLAPGGGPYSADYVIDGGESQRFSVNLRDPDPKESFLSGTIAGGIFLPSQVANGAGSPNKSHVWIRGDIAKIGRDYQPPILKVSKDLSEAAVEGVRRPENFLDAPSTEAVPLMPTH